MKISLNDGFNCSEQDAELKNARVANIKTQPTLQDQASLSRFIGSRIKEARLAINLNQVEGAKRLGLKNSGQLAKIENGQTTKIPVWLLRRASISFDVSNDFLLGITTTMQNSEGGYVVQKELYALMFADFDRRNAKNIAMMIVLQKKIENIEALIIKASAEMTHIKEAETFILNQPEWQDIKGGNRYINAVNNLIYHVQYGSNRFKDFKKDIELQSKAGYQMDLLLEI